MSKQNYLRHIYILRFIIQNVENDHKSTKTVALHANPILDSAPVSLEGMNWSDIRRFRVHNHGCGHATFSDIRTLLVRNKLWNDNVQKYIVKTMTEFQSCKASPPPPPSCRVSLASINRELDDVIRIDHFFLDTVTIFHMMNVASRLSAGMVV